MITRSFLFAVFLLQFSFLHAEVNDSIVHQRYYLGVTGGYGFLWAHSPGMGNMVNDHTIGAEIRFSKQTSGLSEWERDFHLPQCGISLLALNLGDPDRIGYGIGLIPFVNFPLGEMQRKVKMHFYVGCGPGWVTKIFHPETNHQNNAIGTHLNACIRLRLNAQGRLNERLVLEGGVELTHFSNGASKLPNLGVNLPAITLGLHYNIAKRSVADYDKNLQTVEGVEECKSWSFTTCLSSGMSSIELVTKKRYPAFNVLTYAMWKKSSKHKFGGGIDLMWSAGIKERRERRGDAVTVVNNIQPGMKVCYELVLGKMSWPFEAGVYLYSPYLIEGSVYSRFGIRYTTTKHFCFGVNLKTNLTVAEYIEGYIGWKL